MTKIFMTPWIDLNDIQLASCILSGADSARIHASKASPKLINHLINFYNNNDFKFYLDLRGNKAHTLNDLDIKVGETILITSNLQLDNPQGTNVLKFNFIPKVFNTFNHKTTTGNIDIDDGNIVLDIIDITKTKYNISSIKTIVSKADNPHIFTGDGISSSTLDIHANKNTALIKHDMGTLSKIPLELRNKVKYVAISFCENKQQLEDAEETLIILGYNAQLVPKIETVKGIKNIYGILKWLKKSYSTKAEVMIGRGDLSLDILKNLNNESIKDLIFEAIHQAKKYNVKISVLALILQSLRWKLKRDPNTTDLAPTEEELENIKAWKEAGVYQIGLTNDMYVDNPTKVITVLKDALNGDYYS